MKTTKQDKICELCDTPVGDPKCVDCLKVKIPMIKKKFGGLVANIPSDNPIVEEN